MAVDYSRDLGELESFTSDAWVVPYGNLMTILMIFFLVLYAYTYLAGDINYERVTGRIQKDLGGSEVAFQESEAVDKFKQYLNEKGLQKFTQVEINAERIKIMLAQPVLFASGESELKKESEELLDVIGEVIQQLPNAVLIEGYTDNLPLGPQSKYRSNWELSASRSFRVAEYLIEKREIDPRRFGIRGYGENRPLYPNDSEEHRSANRRIEISLDRTASRFDAEKIKNMQKHWWYGMYYYRNGDLEKAITELEAILKIDPTHLKSRRMLEEVKERWRKLNLSYYLVQPGDDLRKIAGRPEVYADSECWKLIYSANQKVLKSPYDIRLLVGREIIIPPKE